MSRWYRAYEGTVTDGKLGEAALIAGCSRAIVIAAWHAVLESCAAANDGGRFDTTPRRIAAILAEPVATIEGAFAAFSGLGMIEAGRVCSWSRRQFESDSSTERSRKHREAKRNGDLMRGHALETSPQGDETPMQRCATPPDTETETDSLPPMPAAEREPQPRGGDFAQFWRAMPSPNPATKSAALATFRRLSPPDQARAIAGAERYAIAFAAKPTTHPISAARFLRDRCFMGYSAPRVTTEAATVMVRVDTPQWAAWTKFRGKPIPLNREGTGWRFPTEWPPDAERGAA
jgi:hypothetical protein